METGIAWPARGHYCASSVRGGVPIDESHMVVASPVSRTRPPNLIHRPVRIPYARMSQ
jgi:hypothetical protein